MKDILSSKDIVMRDFTRKYLQRNLKKLNIIKFQNIEGKLYVYSKSLTTEQLLALYVNVKTELEQLKKQIVTTTLLSLEIQLNQYEKKLCSFKTLFHGYLNLRI